MEDRGMKLNHDCVRSVLLDIEEKHKMGIFLTMEDFIEDSHSSKFSKEDITYSIFKLDEAKFTNTTLTWNSGEIVYFSTGSLTWEGHKFLDNIRDNGVWKDTKGVLSKFSSTSISIVSDVASSVILKLVEKQLGLS